ncbi:MAG TPA: hypothetical protein VNO21_13795, partial [Polyangiaceae bacterium]|nr:hypothetical protein [Polyangiaceae bacterium]
VLVAPLDDVLPMYESDPTTVPISAKEAGTPTPKIVLPAYLTSAYLDRFEADAVGQLTRKSLAEVDLALRALLALE